ncbi:MAG TPA: sigma-E factor negative regulatory protein [Candidatus Saccharimonadia bacterium]|nr:sigma-E factor negative regulatory protein [Candidatus Saccharimonadia bacterium]
MNPTVNEQVSALADGELSPDETRFALRRLDADADLRQSWSRIHLARDCMRRAAMLPAPAGFASGVMAKLDEPAASSAAFPWLKTAAGGLIAAGVAAVALFAVAPRDTVAPATPAPTLAATTPITTEDLRPRIGTLPASDSIVAPLRAVPATLADPRLDQYLIQHSDATLGGMRGGYVPYVYIVSSPARASTRPPQRDAAERR